VTQRSPSVRRPTHNEAGVEFARGFGIYRRYRGEDIRAELGEGGWRLNTGHQIYASHATLMRAFGAKDENPWMAWRYRNARNKMVPLDDYRCGKK